MRLTSSGGVDTSFGSEGEFRSCGGGGEAWEVEEYGGDYYLCGKAGSLLESTLAVFRLDGSGYFDSARLVDFGSTEDDDFHDCEISSAGLLTAFGSAGPENWWQDRQFASARLDVTQWSMPLDTSYDTDGKTLTDFASQSGEEGFGGTLTSGGTAVIVGSGGSPSSAVCDAIRLTSTGALDSTFDSDGKVITSVASSASEALEDVVSSGSNLVAVGTASGMGLVVRYTSSGALDSTFSSDGIVTLDLVGRTVGFREAVVDTSGRIYACGVATLPSGNRELLVVRLTTNGALDTTYSSDGVVVLSATGAGAGGEGCAQDSSGRILIAGWSTDGYSVVARLTTGGALDSSFSGDGYSYLSTNEGSYRALDVLVDSAGKPLLVESLAAHPNRALFRGTIERDRLSSSC